MTLSTNSNEAKFLNSIEISIAGRRLGEIAQVKGVEIDGKNWLIPVDAQIKSEIDVYAEAINLETPIDISVMPKIIGLVSLALLRCSD